MAHGKSLEHKQFLKERFPFGLKGYKRMLINGKSLVISNEHYREWITKYNILGTETEETN